MSIQESMTDKIAARVDALNAGEFGGWNGDYGSITAGNGSTNQCIKSE